MWTVHSCTRVVCCRSFWFGDNWHNHSAQLPCCPNQLLVSIYSFHHCWMELALKSELTQVPRKPWVWKKSKTEEANVCWRKNTNVICLKLCQTGKWKVDCYTSPIFVTRVKTLCINSFFCIVAICSSVVENPALLSDGLLGALVTFAVLLAHEAGHLYAAQKVGAKLGFPYLVPSWQAWVASLL